MHAELKVGDSILMLGEPSSQWKPMPAAFYLYVTDCDATYRRALSAGSEVSVAEPADQFYGDRHCGVRDAAGNLWWIATHKEDVSPAEMKRRQTEMEQKPEPEPLCWPRAAAKPPVGEMRIEPIAPPTAPYPFRTGMRVRPTFPMRYR